MQLFYCYNKVKGKQSYCDAFATLTLISQQKSAVFVFYRWDLGHCAPQENDNLYNQEVV